jgi:hypothetical protein
VLEVVRDMPNARQLARMAYAEQKARAQLFERISDPERSRARAKRQYEIDRLVEIFSDGIRRVRAGQEALGVWHGLTAAIGTPNPLGAVAIAIADGRTIAAAYQSEIDVALSTGVSTWGNLVSTFDDLVQATGANQPSYTTVESTLNNRAKIAGNGTDQWMSGAPNRPTPGTTPTAYRAVMRPDGYSANKRLIGVVSIRWSGTTNQIIMDLGGTTGNAITVTPNTWYRWRSLWNNATSDYVRAGSTLGTGASIGNTDPAGIVLFSGQGPPNNVGAASIADWLILTADMTAAGDAILDQHYVAYYGPNVTVG